MKTLTNIRIGARLAIGFAIVLLLAIVCTSFSVISAWENARATRAMMEKPLAKERLTSDLYLLIYSAVERTTLIAKSSDESLSVTFADAIAAGTKKGGGLLKQVEGMLSGEQEKAAFAAVMQVRGVYQDAKQAVMAAKKTGKAEDAERAYTQQYMPAAEAYQAKVQGFLAQQRQAIDETAQAIERANARSLTLTLVLGVLMIVFGSLCAWLITRSITQPLQAAIEVAATVAAGDLRTQFGPPTRDEVGDLMRALKGMNDALTNVVSQVQTGTHAIATASSEIAAGNQDLSSRTEQQASSLEETASSMEELTSTVKQNADNAREANKLAATASDVAIKGGSVVSQVVDTMSSINESAKKIVDIIGVIDGIAFQTNILALNAAVEAARAGEQGRGFAVVASEVRNLAQRSAGAAKEIKILIDDSAEKTERGTRLVGQAGVTMGEVVDSVRRVTDIMSEIASASAEQSAGIEQVNLSIIEMDGMTQQNAALVEQSAAAAQSLQDQAAELSHVVSIFKLVEGEERVAAYVPAAAPAASIAAPVAAPARKPAAAARPVKSITRKAAAPAAAPAAPKRVTPATTSNDEWEEF